MVNFFGDKNFHAWNTKQMTLKLAHINLAKGLRGGENQTLAIIEGLNHFEIEQTLICRKNSLLEKWLTKLAYKNAATIVSISKNIHAVMLGFSPNQHHKIIPDIARILESNQQEAANLKTQFAGKFIVGHVGALDDSIKNQSLILKTANQLRKNENIVFMLLGSGKDEQYLKKIAMELNLSNVIFEGFKENIADYFALFDIFVYPSKEEGLGSAILEVFHFKKPVIAANVGGIPDILGDNEYGLLINAFNDHELAEKIMTLYQDETLRNHYAEVGFQRKEVFSSDKICGDYYQLYQKMSCA